MADQKRGIKSRSIKSYVLRQGRLTPGQSKALESGWPEFGLKADDGPADLAAIFSNSGPITLEIGFGMGDSLFQQAMQNPSRNYIGIEVHRPGVGHFLMQVLDAGLTNVRVYAEDSIDILGRAIPDTAIDVLQIFFPDPWPKKRHHKRRIIKRDFIELLARKLVPGGIIHMATDWQPYGEEIEALFRDLDQFESIASPSRPETKFERRGLGLGHVITDLAYRIR